MESGNKIRSVQKLNVATKRRTPRAAIKTPSLVNPMENLERRKTCPKSVSIVSSFRA